MVTVIVSQQEAEQMLGVSPGGLMGWDLFEVTMPPMPEDPKEFIHDCIGMIRQVAAEARSQGFTVDAPFGFGDKPN